MTSGICWSDATRGNAECARDDLRAVDWKGGIALGCGKCKRILGFTSAPSMMPYEPPDGWQEIPAGWMV
jgi:hypothetical protein